MSIINPKSILEKGILTLPKTVNVDKVLQPNGIDLSVASIEELFPVSEPMILGDDVPTLHVKSSPLPLFPMSPVALQAEDYAKYKKHNCYELKAGKQYKIETGYELHLPEDMLAYIFTRSSLNRNGILVGSGLWDSGYHGPVGTTLYTSRDLLLIPPVRIAQIVFFKAESALLYQGSYNDTTMKKF